MTSALLFFYKILLFIIFLLVVLLVALVVPNFLSARRNDGYMNTHTHTRTRVKNRYGREDNQSFQTIDFDKSMRWKYEDNNITNLNSRKIR